MVYSKNLCKKEGMKKKRLYLPRVVKTYFGTG